jgi:hypothetical protein
MQVEFAPEQAVSVSKDVMDKLDRTLMDIGTLLHCVREQLSLLPPPTDTDIPSMDITMEGAPHCALSRSVSLVKLAESMVYQTGKLIEEYI